MDLYSVYTNKDFSTHHFSTHNLTCVLFFSIYKDFIYINGTIDINLFHRTLINNNFCIDTCDNNSRIIKIAPKVDLLTF